MTNLTFLKVSQLIIHQPPETEDPTDLGTLSDNETPLVPIVRRFFEERIKEAMKTAGIKIAFVANHESPVPTVISGLLDNPAKPFVDGSKVIASQLFGLKNQSYSRGLLCILKCSLQLQSAIAILKLDFEEGARAELKSGKSGQKHFEIEMVDDLMLTKSTKVFKVALFERIATGTVEAIACDNQRARTEFISKYFLDDFLGCELSAQPSLTTKQFFDAAEAFVDDIADPQTSARYQSALLAEMNRNVNTISPRTFADQNLEKGDRQPFLDALKTADVPLASFGKDVKLIKTRLTRIRFAFANDLDVLVPPGQLGETVTYAEEEDGDTLMKLKAKLEHIRGGK